QPHTLVLQHLSHSRFELILSYALPLSLRAQIMAEGGPDDETLELTPTWILAIVCAVMVVISMAAERGLHYL
uniref:Uncharacterized protein n=1 Tax=Aegilops tauschii subsp. strangulata TaxID=200361 RepID=A0A453DNK0_AEGTS